MWGTPRGLREGVAEVHRWEAFGPGTYLSLGELPTEGVAPPFLDALHAEVWESFQRTFGGSGQPHALGLLWETEVSVWGGNALVADASGRPFHALHWQHPKIVQETLELLGKSDTQARALSPQHRLEGPCVLLAAPWHWNYYHWMVDVLPKVTLLAPLLSDVSLTWLTPPLDALRRESLVRLGVPLERQVTMPLEHWQVGSLIVPTAAAPYLSSRPETLLPVRNALVKKRVPTFRRLYISRADAGSRRLLEEDALVQALSVFGFTSVCLTGMDAEAQWTLFAQAEAVIAPHGAGLSNLMFCAPGTLVIELMPIHHASFVYYTLSQAVGLRYLFLLGFPEQGAQSALEAPYRVELSQLLTLVGQLLG